MKITIDIRDDWRSDVLAAIDIDGSNDDEHDLLVEIADEVALALPKPRPRYSFSVVELAGWARHQGEILQPSSAGPNWTAPELGDLIGNFLDEWIARCSTAEDGGEAFPPALKINITRRDGET